MILLAAVSFLRPVQQRSSDMKTYHRFSIGKDFRDEKSSITATQNMCYYAPVNVNPHPGEVWVIVGD